MKIKDFNDSEKKILRLASLKDELTLQDIRKKAGVEIKESEIIVKDFIKKGIAAAKYKNSVNIPPEKRVYLFQYGIRASIKGEEIFVDLQKQI